MKNLILVSVISLSFPLANASDFSYEDLVKIAQDKNSVEEVLPLLPESFRSNYTLMHSSQSLQGSSYENPRAIMFGENAKLICSFNGDPSHRGYDSLECIQFRDKERKFDFRQIQFPTSENKLTKVAFSESGRTTDGAISCSMCHTQDPRPNWEEYNVWPNAYGQNDDYLGVDRDKYFSYVKSRDQHPRYRWLIQDSYEGAPYMGPASSPEERPNLRLSEFAGKWNSLRMNRILRSKLPEWRMIAFAIGTLTHKQYGKCDLTDAQKAILTKDGIVFSDISRMANIVHDAGLFPEEAGTSIAVELKNSPDHQNGFGFLSLDITMSIVQDLANDGNPVFKETIQKLKTDYESYPMTLFNQKLAEIVPHLSPFLGSSTGREYESYVNTLCPELIDLFMKKYLEARAARNFMKKYSIR
jgi:hypothetical protein